MDSQNHVHLFSLALCLYPVASVQSYQLAILIVQDQLLTLMLTLGEALAQSSWMMWHALDQSPD